MPSRSRRRTSELAARLRLGNGCLGIADDRSPVERRSRVLPHLGSLVGVARHPGGLGDHRDRGGDLPDGQGARQAGSIPMTRAEEAYWLPYFGWCPTYGIAIGAIFTASSRGDIFSMAAILIFQGIAVFKLL